MCPAIGKRTSPAAPAAYVLTPPGGPIRVAGAFHAGRLGGRGGQWGISPTRAALAAGRAAAPPVHVNRRPAGPPQVPPWRVNVNVTVNGC